MPRESEDWRPSPEREYADTEMQQILAEAVEKSEPEYRIVLRDVEELSTEDTEEALGITVVRDRVGQSSLRTHRSNRVLILARCPFGQ
jgi:DNA-directed RNA polymerase specialized sigma24 family protein